MTVQGISTNARKMIGWGAIPVPLSTAAIIMRFIARRSTKSLGPDDWVMLFAYFLYLLLYATFVIWATVGKAGWPQEELSLVQIEAFLRAFFAVQLIYALVGPSIKLSILLLYRRIFAPIKAMMLATIIVGTLVLGWAIAVVVTVIVECLPVGSYWNPLEPRHCINSQKFYWANGISNLILDFTVLCLPIPAILKIKMPLERRLLVVGILSLGIFVCTASILRITYLWKINFSNVTGTAAIPSIWTSLEPGLGIVTGCLPTLPPLLKKMRKRQQGAQTIELGATSRQILRQHMNLPAGQALSEEPLVKSKPDASYTVSVVSTSQHADELDTSASQQPRMFREVRVSFGSDRDMPSDGLK